MKLINTIFGDIELLELGKLIIGNDIILRYMSWSEKCGYTSFCIETHMHYSCANAKNAFDGMIQNIQSDICSIKTNEQFNRVLDYSLDNKDIIKIYTDNIDYFNSKYLTKTHYIDKDKRQIWKFKKL